MRISTSVHAGCAPRACLADRPPQRRPPPPRAVATPFRARADVRARQLDVGPPLALAATGSPTPSMRSTGSHRSGRCSGRLGTPYARKRLLRCRVLEPLVEGATAPVE